MIRRNRVGTKRADMCVWGDIDAVGLGGACGTQEYIQRLIRKFKIYDQ